ncbi:MAG TPA: hypothetical protein VH912_00975, partial [Streptosporangiaceae bacterium]
MRLMGALPAEELVMRKIIYWVHTSIDGYIAGPNGEFDRPAAGPELFGYSEAMNEQVAAVPGAEGPHQDDACRIADVRLEDRPVALQAPGVTTLRVERPRRVQSRAR